MRTGSWMIRAAASTVLSTLGWWVGAMVGTFTAYVLATIAGGYGIYLGGRIARQLF